MWSPRGRGRQRRGGWRHFGGQAAGAVRDVRPWTPAWTGRSRGSTSGRTGRDHRTAAAGRSTASGVWRSPSSCPRGRSGPAAVRDEHCCRRPSQSSRPTQASLCPTCPRTGEVDQFRRAGAGSVLPSWRGSHSPSYNSAVEDSTEPGTQRHTYPRSTSGRLRSHTTGLRRTGTGRQPGGPSRRHRPHTRGQRRTGPLLCTTRPR